MASRQAESSRASPGPRISAYTMVPERSTRNVPRLANPAPALNTPYAWATAPCGQKSASSGNS